MKKRISFDFTQDAYDTLSEVREKGNCQTKADAIRKSLKLYSLWLRKTRDEGCTLIFINRDGKKSDIEIIL